MPIHELAALAVALTWAFTGILSADPSRHLGAIAFNSYRQLMVLGMLLAWVFVTSSVQAITAIDPLPLLLSGFIGIFLGDTALFLTMNRLGPRRTAILFSLNAPMSAVLGWMFLDELLPMKAIIGIGLTMAGVILAIIFGKRKDQLHQWENVTGALWIGVLLGLTAALCQAIGALVMRPVMLAGADPVAASVVRISVAVIGLFALRLLPFDWVRQRNPLTPAVAGQVAASGFLGMALGMTLILFALSGGKVGIITTLSATTPVMMLPVLWWRTREVPAAGAWVGAVLVIIGSALIFNR